MTQQFYSWVYIWKNKNTNSKRYMHPSVHRNWKNNFYWSIVDLQSCVSFKCTAKWIHYTCTCVYSFCCCCCSVTHSCPTLWNPWTAARQASLSLTVSRSLPRFLFIALVMLSNHLILWLPLLLPSIFPSIRVFSKESSVHIRWPKDWNFSFSISPSSEYSGLISLKIDWFDLLALQMIVRSLLQHHSSKASILWHSAFVIVQLSQPYMITGKTIALTIWTLLAQ